MQLRAVKVMVSTESSFLIAKLLAKKQNRTETAFAKKEINNEMLRVRRNQEVSHCQIFENSNFTKPLYLIDFFRLL